MKTELLDDVKYAVKNWWMSLIVGILFVAFAILLMFQPVDAFVSLTIVFCICFFIYGIFEIAFSISNKDNLSGWGWYLTCGILDILIGIVMVCIPEVAMSMIPLMIAFWLMFRGFSGVALSIDMQRYGAHNWGWYLVFGILAVLCSIGIIFVPAAGALTAVYMAAFSFLFIGIFRIAVSFDLKNLKDNSENLKQKIQDFQKKIQG